MFYAKLINKNQIIKIQKGGSYGAIRFGKKSKDEAYAKYDFYPFVAGESIPSDKVPLASTYAFVDGKVVETTHLRDLTEEEIAQKQQELFENAKIEAEQLVKELVQEQFDIYNKENGTIIEGLDSLPRFILDPKSLHRKWAKKVNGWNGRVWKKLREIQSDVLSGKKEIPTREELIKILPRF